MISNKVLGAKSSVRNFVTYVLAPKNRSAYCLFTYRPWGTCIMYNIFRQLEFKYICVGTRLCIKMEFSNCFFTTLWLDRILVIFKNLKYEKKKLKI